MPEIKVKNPFAPKPEDDWVRPPQCDPSQGAQPNTDVPQDWFACTIVFFPNEVVEQINNGLPVDASRLQVGIGQTILTTVTFCHCGQCPPASADDVAMQYAASQIRTLEEQGLTIVGHSGTIISDNATITLKEGASPLAFVGPDCQEQEFPTDRSKMN